jgi:hypothetical protein
MDNRRPTFYQTISIMCKALIRLAYKQIIDSSSAGTFEKEVFNDSYAEFLLQMQAYNQEGSCTTFQEVVAANPKASSLHYKTGFAIGLYVKGLHHQIPNLQDSLEQISIPFSTHQFAIIDSDITNKTKHKVSVTYTTDTLLLLDCVGDHLLLSFAGPSKANEELETFLLKLAPNLSINSYRSL